MSLNIKNPHVHALAREASTRSGQSQTGAIQAALERYLAELDATGGSARRAAVDRILDKLDDDLTDVDRATLTTDDLYDDSGLPA